MIRRWACVLQVDAATRPGIVARVAQVFAQRGISLDDFLAVTWQGRPVIALRFVATERMQGYIVRRLERMNDVHDAHVSCADERPIWEFLDAPPDAPET